MTKDFHIARAPNGSFILSIPRTATPGLHEELNKLSKDHVTEEREDRTKIGQDCFYDGYLITNKWDIIGFLQRNL